MEPSNLVIILVAAALGAAVGWLVAAQSKAAELRAAAETKDSLRAMLDGLTAERDQARGELGEIQREREGLRAELAAANERATGAERLAAELPGLRAELETQRSETAEVRAEVAALRQRATQAERLAAELPGVRAEREKFRADLATLQANAENFAEQKRLLLEAQAVLKKEFEAAGAKILEGAQDAFLKRAQDRFSESEKANEARIKALLEPVGARLKSYEEQVATLEKQRVDGFGQLSGLIQSMRDGQEAVRAEAARLGNSLRNAPKARGRWGEQQLRNVLEQCGLAEHTDFETEVSIDTAEGRLRPDAIVRIPGNKLLVIDAKVSLNAYQGAFECDDDTSRKAFLDQHAASMRNHIQTLGTKSYQSQFEDAPDYVLMFVPGEHFIAAALEHDPELWNFAFERRVLLASPTNLVAIARTVAQVWRQDGLAREAKEIGRMGGELYDRLAIAADHLKRVGSGLDTAVTNYNKFVGSFERNVLSAGRRLKDKHIEIGKREIEAVPLVEAAPRYADAGSVVEPAAPRLIDPANDEAIQDTA